jgi:hypothetical protein
MLSFPKMVLPLSAAQVEHGADGNDGMACLHDDNAEHDEESICNRLVQRLVVLIKKARRVTCADFFDNH